MGAYFWIGANFPVNTVAVVCRTCVCVMFVVSSFLVRAGASQVGHSPFPVASANQLIPTVNLHPYLSVMIRTQ